MLRERASFSPWRRQLIDGTGPPGYKFTPLGFGVQGEMTKTTSKWLSDTALAVAKRQSDDVNTIDKLKKRIRMRFVQRLSVELMKAQADMILNHVINARRARYLTAPSHGRRAGHGRGHGSAAGRGGARGGRGPASRAGHGR